MTIIKVKPEDKKKINLKWQLSGKIEDKVPELGPFVRIPEKHIDSEAALKSAFLSLVKDDFGEFYNVLSSFVPVLTMAVTTMAVTQIKGKNIFLFNPEFIKYSSYSELRYNVKHECLHIIFNHLGRGARFRDAMKIKYPELSNKQGDEIISHCINYAADALIDSVIGNLLSYDVTHETLNTQMVGLGSADDKAFEITAENMIINIIKNSKNNQKNNDDVEFDNDRDLIVTPEQIQQMLSEMSDGKLEQFMCSIDMTPTDNRKDNLKNIKESMASQLSEEQTNQMNEMMQSGLKSINPNKLRGVNTNPIKTELAWIDEKPMINSRRLLEGILGNYKDSGEEHYYTYTVPNRNAYNGIYDKSNIILSGQRTNPIKLVTLAFDTSGSVSDEMLQRMWTETIGICKNRGIVIEKLYLADFEICKVYKEEEINSPQKIKRNAARHGNGGTSVIATLKAFQDDKSSTIFIFTDGYIDDPESVRTALNFNKMSKKKIFWIFINNDRKYKVYNKDTCININM